MSESSARRIKVEAVSAALLVALIHLVLRVGALVGAYEDDGVYVVLGKAIALGDGYRSIHLVGAPVQVRYPPGLPLLLSLPWAMGGSLSAVQLTAAVANLVATAAATGLLWWVGRRVLGLEPLTLGVLAVSPLVLDATIALFNIPLAEPYFVLGWAGALAMSAPLLAETPRSRPGQVRSAASLGLVLAATTLFRTVAIALVPGVVVALLVHRRRAEAAICCAVALLPLAAWAALRASWVARGPVSPFPDDLGYWSWLGLSGPMFAIAFIGRTVLVNASAYWRELASLLLPARSVGMAVVLAAVLFAGVVGVIRFRRHTVLILTVLCASALTLMWPFAQGRLILPLLPFAGLLVAVAVDGIGKRNGPRVALGIRGVLLVVATVVAWRQIQLRANTDRAFLTGVLPPLEDRSPMLTVAFRSRLIFQVSDWIRSHASVHDRIMVQVPSGVYLYTGRQTVAAAPTESPVAPSVFAVHGQYLGRRILADSLTLLVWTPATVGLGEDIAAVQQRCPDVLTRADSSPNPPLYFRVTRVEHCLQALAPPTSLPPKLDDGSAPS